MDDIESHCDEEGNKLINIPEDFDDIVDIAVEEQQLLNEEGRDEDEGKPFWMRYFKADYLGESDPTYQKILEKEGVTTAEEENKNKVENQEIQKKLIEEYSKIRDLDMDLIDSNKVYK